MYAEKISVQVLSRISLLKKITHIRKLVLCLHNHLDVVMKWLKYGKFFKKDGVAERNPWAVPICLKKIFFNFFWHDMVSSSVFLKLWLIRYGFPWLKIDKLKSDWIISLSWYCFTYKLLLDIYFVTFLFIIL